MAGRRWERRGRRLGKLGGEVGREICGGEICGGEGRAATSKHPVLVFASNRQRAHYLRRVPHLSIRAQMGMLGSQRNGNAPEGNGGPWKGMVGLGREWWALEGNGGCLLARKGMEGLVARLTAKRARKEEQPRSGEHVWDPPPDCNR